MRGSLAAVLAGGVLLAAGPGTAASAADSPPAEQATAGRYVVDEDASRVRFTLGATAHTVEGTGRLLRGHLTAAGDGDITGEVVVDATSFSTRNARRDRKMHGEVLESETYPEIVLRITALEGPVPTAGDGAVEIEGTLDLHGDTHDVRVPVLVKMTGDRFVATADLVVPYVSWGLKDPSVFFLRVDKQVEVTVEIVGQRRPLPQAGDAGEPAGGSAADGEPGA